MNKTLLCKIYFCSFRTLACEQGLIHTAVWAAKPARGLSRVLIPDSWHTFHEFRRCYCIVNESWLLFEWVAPYCMKKSLLSLSHSTIYHKSWLLWNRALTRDKVLISFLKQGAHLFFETGRSSQGDKVLISFLRISRMWNKALMFIGLGIKKTGELTYCPWALPC